MNRKNRTFLMILLTIAIILLFTGCLEARSDQEVTTLIPTEIKNTLLSSTPQFAATISEKALSPTPAVISTSNPIEATHECPKSNTNSPILERLDIPGTIIFTGEKKFGVFGLAEDLKTRYEIANFLTEYDILGMSHDGQWLAISRIERGSDGKIRLEREQVTIVSSSGEKKNSILDLEEIKGSSLFLGYFDPEPLNLLLRGHWTSHWLSSNLIFTGLIAEEQDCGIRCFPNFIPIIFDPFTGEIFLSMTADFPKWYQEPLDISTDLTRVLYNGENGMYLRDLPSRNRLFLDDEAIGYIIKWSPNNQKVLYADSGINVLPEEVSIVDRDGIGFTRVTLPGASQMISGISWSPDNTKIALLVNMEKDLMILVYDLEEETFTVKCSIPVQANAGIDPVWSPDNRLIAFGIGVEDKFFILDSQNSELFLSSLVGVPAIWVSESMWGQ